MRFLNQRTRRRIVLFNTHSSSALLFPSLSSELLVQRGFHEMVGEISNGLHFPVQEPATDVSPLQPVYSLRCGGQR
jgi:hypothetical protein